MRCSRLSLTDLKLTARQDASGPRGAGIVPEAILGEQQRECTFCHQQLVWLCLRKEGLGISLRCVVILHKPLSANPGRGANLGQWRGIDDL